MRLDELAEWDIENLLENEGFENIEGKDVKRKYPELWDEICKVEGFAKEEGLDRVYVFQKLGLPRGVTHAYTTNSAVILATYGSKKRHPMGLGEHLLGYDLPFECLFLETGDVRKLITADE